jgi:hypothetical protein
MNRKQDEKKDTTSKKCRPRTRRKKKSERLPSKILPVNGSLETRRVKCGRSNCKCAKGELHGPYTYVRTYSGGERWRKYIKKSEKQAILADMSAYKQQRIEQRQARERNQEFAREMRQNNKEFRLMLQLIRKGVIKL